MKYTIARFNLPPLEIEGESLKQALEEAVRKRPNRQDVNLQYTNLQDVNLQYTNLQGADLQDVNLRGAVLQGANLQYTNLQGADLQGAVLHGADLHGAVLQYTNLQDADLQDADLHGAVLQYTNLRGTVLRDANLQGADLQDADLQDANGLVKLMGVVPGNVYWKRFEGDLNNNGFQFKLGLNTLREGEVFAADERVLCSYPGFHFASRSWCAANYQERPLEAKIRIPEDAQINEPWATDGKASADKIEILQIFDVRTGQDVTSQFR